MQREGHSLDEETVLSSTSDIQLVCGSQEQLMRGRFIGAERTGSGEPCTGMLIALCAERHAPTASRRLLHVSWEKSRANAGHSGPLRSAWLGLNKEGRETCSAWTCKIRRPHQVKKNIRA